ncbi:hypothetical protein J7E49_06935 [Variovorax paradoxus]|nr:hypothetical protein [Variovorax paradoxus]
MTPQDLLARMTAPDAFLPPIGDAQAALALQLANVADRLTEEEIETFVGLGTFIGRRMARLVPVRGSVGVGSQ